MLLYPGNLVLKNTDVISSKTISVQQLNTVILQTYFVRFARKMLSKVVIAVCWYTQYCFFKLKSTHLTTFEYHHISDLPHVFILDDFLKRSGQKKQRIQNYVTLTGG